MNDDEKEQMKIQIKTRNRRLRNEIDMEIDSIIEHTEKIKKLREMFLEEDKESKGGERE